MIAGALEVQMFANIARLASDMNEAKGLVGNAMGSVEKSVQSAKNVLASLGLGLSVGVMVGKFQQIAVETDKLRGNLVTMTGSSDAAGIAFDNLTKFAAKTPFTLDQSVSAFIKLKALGLDPSERALMSYGNTAAAMGKDMSQMIEAVADASTNEFERLKEFGIKAKQQGDNVTFTFQGVSTTVKKESEAIQGYLLGIGENKFGDAMANQMERLPGKLSNLEDSIDGLFRKMADDGGTNAFGSAIGGATNVVGFLADNIDTLYLAAEAMALLMSGKMVSSLSAATTESGKKLMATIAATNAEKLAAKVELDKAAATNASAIADLNAAKSAAARTPGFYMNATAVAGLTAAEKSATVAATAHTVALERMSVASAAASFGSRALSASLAFVGGSVGAAVLAAGALYYFAQKGEDATEQTERLRGEVDKLVASFGDLTLAEIDDKISNSMGKLSDLVAEQASLVEPKLGMNSVAYGHEVDQYLTKKKELDEGIQATALLVSELSQRRVAASDKEVEAVEAQTEASNKYINSLKVEIERVGMAERAVYLLEAADKAGADASDEQRAEAVRLAEVLYDKKEALDENTEAAKEAKKAEDELRKTLETQSNQVVALIGDYRNKINMVGKSDREQYIYNETMKVGEGATLQTRLAVIALAETYYDMAEAARVSAAAEEKAAKDREKAAEDEAKKMADNWQRTHEFVTNSLIDLGDNGKNFWEDLGEIASKTIKRIVAEWTASGIMGMFSGQGLGGFTTAAFGGAPGSPGSVGSLLSTGSTLSSIAGMAGGAGQFIGGLTGTAVGTGASTIVGAPTAAAAAGSGLSASLGALATNPATWAIAALVYAASQDFWKDPDGYKRSFAGLLTAPTPGAAGSTFSVDPFASGFNAQGIAHNTSQQSAIDSINVFREVDAKMFELVTKLGGTLDLTNATLSGTGLDGKAGTSGTFLGMGGRTTEQDIAAMVNQFVGDLSNHVTGIDDELLKSIKSAQTAEDVMRLLSDAVGDLAKDQVDAIGKISAAQVAAVAALNAQVSVPSRNVFGEDQWAETARQARGFVSAENFSPELQAVFIAAGMNRYGEPIDGSHASGLDYVPFDGYRAELHRGERVQTASQARSDDSQAQDMRSMMVEMRRMVQYTKKTSDLLMRVTRDGDSLVTVAA